MKNTAVRILKSDVPHLSYTQPYSTFNAAYTQPNTESPYT